MDITFRFHTEIDGVRQVVNVTARTSSQARRILTNMLWDGERILF